MFSMTFFFFSYCILFNQDVEDRTKEHVDHDLQNEEFEETPLYAAILTYLSYAILCVFGWLRDFLRQSNIERKRGAVDPNASLVSLKSIESINIGFDSISIRVSFLFIKVMNHFTREICTREFVIFSIDRSRAFRALISN